ncbi:hypothetical protein [Siccirubricoccus phaeus]|uniref:hypothetical protein n=1 Tax=Siccirubricoccus phaeus TaxID=2595053 RepID=UPI0011F21C27|nr:hypothetical protein [Siccirubricoccus phaeus]
MAAARIVSAQALTSVRIGRLVRTAAVAVLAAGQPGAGAASEAALIPPGLLAEVRGDDGQAIPLNADGVPARSLSDPELFRLLLHLSRFLDEASLRLALCHASGVPFGDPGWRACVEGR